MQQDQTEQYSQTERRSNYRGVGHIVRGLLFVLIGLFILFADRFGIGAFSATAPVRYTMGGIAVLLGAFRIFQGIRSTSMNNRR